MSNTEQTNERESNSAGDTTRRDAYIGLAVGGAILVIGLILSTVSGFGPYEGTSMEARAPTLWDWMELLIVPAVLALGALWFNKTQKDTELNIAEKARTADHDIAEKARVTDHEIAEARQRQTTLEAYYDRMTELLLTYKLREAEKDAEERSIARARTVAVVRSLDEERNRQLFAFLKASKLIESGAPIIDPLGIDFSNADLSGANLSEADLHGADLHGAHLRGVNLSKANLRGADLHRADLLGADLSGADLSGADLCEANLREAHLGGADLGDANLSKANLRGADLRGAYLSGADLSGALLGRAFLSNARLREVHLSGAHLRGADLSGADLRGADLSEADLFEAINWTFEQLEQANQPTAVTMPDGVKLKGPENEGPTFQEWKAQYLAKQEAERGQNEADSKLDDTTANRQTESGSPEPS